MKRFKKYLLQKKRPIVEHVPETIGSARSPQQPQRTVPQQLVVLSPGQERLVLCERWPPPRITNDAIGGRLPWKCQCPARRVTIIKAIRPLLCCSVSYQFVIGERGSIVDWHHFGHIGVINIHCDRIPL